MSAGQVFVALIGFAIQSWIVVLVAILIGRYIGKPVRMPLTGWGKAKLIIATYLVTFCALLAGGYFSILPNPLLSLILPLVAGSATARAMMARSWPAK